MDGNDALVLVFSRNAFYRRLHFLVLAALALSLIVIGVLFSTVLFLLRNPTHPLYFATDTVGRLIQVIPVNQPNMSSADVTAWAIEAAQATYSYDYINYRAQLQNAQKYFTTYGWNRYMGALKASNNIVALTQRKMIVLAQVVGQAKLTRQGLLGGAYAWRYEMPMLVTYLLPPYDSKSSFSNALQVSMVVQRQPVLQGYKGLGIVQIIGAIATAPGSNMTQEITAPPAG